MFDPSTMTIKTLSQSNRSLNVANNGRSVNLEINSTNGQWWQIFKYQGERILNCQSGKVMEVTNAADGQNVFVQHRPNNSIKQKFMIRYVDNTKVDRKYSKGELNKEFGIKVGLPFSIYTRMQCARAI